MEVDALAAVQQVFRPIVGFNFMLRVEAVYDLPCKGIKAFSREMEYEYIQEGGLNDYVHMRRKPISRPFTLEVERYAGVDIIDPLPLGAELILPLILFVSRYQDQWAPVARTYVFTGCTVTKKEYGKLDAERSELLTETTTIAYREMLCVDVPAADLIGTSATRRISSGGNSDNIPNKADDTQKPYVVKPNGNSDNVANRIPLLRPSPRVRPNSNSDNIPNKQ
jgi:hypothetical protein